MLSWFRNNTSSVGMIILIGLLILSFAFWDVQSYFNQSVNGAVAVVNGEEITVSEWQQRMSNYRQNLLNQYGQDIEPDYFDSPVIRRDLLNQLINEKLMLQMASENGFVATPELLRDSIQSQPIFLDENGQFNKENYAFFLSQRGDTAASFESRIQNDLMASAVNRLISDTHFITPAESKSHRMLTKQLRSFDYFLIKPADFQEGIEPSTEEIQAYYDENADRYMTEETVSVEYVELQASDIAAAVEIDEAEAEAEFEKNKESYKKEEQRKTSHILVNVAANASDEDKAAALEKIQGLKTQIDGGADFAQLATENSDDPGSPGGDLGWVETGDMVAPFEEALFAMEVGTISEPVLSQFGYHLIQLNEIKEGGYPDFSEVRDDVIGAMQALEADTQYLERYNDLEIAVLDSESGLQGVADSLGLELKTTEFFSRSGGAGIAANPEFISAAFSAEVKDELGSSSAINLGDTHVAFLRLVEHVQPERKPLEEVQASIVLAIKTEKAQDQARELADQVVAQINSGESTLEAAAETNGTEVVKAADVARSGSSQPFNLVRNVFKLPRPAEGVDPKAVQVESNGTDLAVVKLINVVVKEDEENTDQTQTAQLERNVRANEMVQIITAMRELSSVTINEDLLSQN
ncbi:SurA N-terminal domain-containing protein [Marinicella sp. W31]|uniref:SurA N-terminal domain-containing protein n=1 Tax=Marinicella sp. W31 TaxID=3023713 RepID=UPI0037582AAB